MLLIKTTEGKYVNPKKFENFFYTYGTETTAKTVWAQNYKESAVELGTFSGDKVMAQIVVDTLCDHLTKADNGVINMKDIIAQVDEKQEYIEGIAFMAGEISSTGGEIDFPTGCEFYAPWSGPLNDDLGEPQERLNAPTLIVRFYGMFDESGAWDQDKLKALIWKLQGLID